MKIENCGENIRKKNFESNLFNTYNALLSLHLNPSFPTPYIADIAGHVYTNKHTIEKEYIDIHILIHYIFGAKFPLSNNI